jgi:integrase
VRLRVRDVSHGNRIATPAIALQQKTAKPVQFEITPPTRETVAQRIKEATLGSDDFLFPSRLHDSPHLGTRQYARIVDSWIQQIGLDPTEYDMHSMRRTQASLVYRRTMNLRLFGSGRFNLPASSRETSQCLLSNNTRQGAIADR